jgi:2-isopropylmalate synthase
MYDRAYGKVRILEGERGTRAVTRVLVGVQSEAHRWTAVGVSATVVEASGMAVADALQYGLAEVGTERGRG